MIASDVNLLQQFEIEDFDLRSVFELPHSGNLAVVLCHFNPCNYVSPVTNLKRVLRWLYTERLPTYAVELRCGRCMNAVPVLPTHPRVIHLQSTSVMFRKDNLWNIAISILPDEYTHVLCIDADAIIIGKEWKQALEKCFISHKAIQPFSRAVWTDSAGHAFKEKMSCGYARANGLPNAQISKFFHSGFAIAVNRSFLQETTGFFNSPIGGGSLFMISAMLGLPNELEPALQLNCPGFLQQYREWATLVHRWSESFLGYIDCDAVHLWHGSRQKRRYAQRFDRLLGFDPPNDIAVTKPHGLHEWSAAALEHKRSMVQQVEQYFFDREEDEVFRQVKE